jgi:eukaryotic-like serine/threonine-protein kinase
MQKSSSGSGSFISFMFSRKFLIQLGLAILVLIVLLLLSMKFIGLYTRHGKELTVPVFYGMTIDEVKAAGYFSQFDFFIIDSLFDDAYKAGAILIQDPLPGSKVKSGRNIYVSVVASSPETVKMPDLKDLTLRQALNVLTSSHLKAGRLNYQPSFDQNAVLEQFFKGDTILPGEDLLKGSIIDLVIGSGDSEYEIPVPFLIGKTRDEAIYDLNTASFNLGREVYLDSVMDQTARVFMQEPLWNSDLPFYPGDSIHLWYKSDELFDFEEYIKKISIDSLPADSFTADTLEEF